MEGINENRRNHKFGLGGVQVAIYMVNLKKGSLGCSLIDIHCKKSCVYNNTNCFLL